MAASSFVTTNCRSRLSPILSRDEDSSTNIAMKEARNTSDSSSSSTGISNNSSSSSNAGTHDIVTETLKDVISLQHNAMRKIRTDAERQKLDYVLKVTYDEVISLYYFTDGTVSVSCEGLHYYAIVADSLTWQSKCTFYH